jgi:hypothetical protein
MMNDNDNKDSLSRGIARLIGSETNARHLRSMPIFRVDHDLPTDFQTLLRQIDGGEQPGSSRRN